MTRVLHKLLAPLRRRLALMISRAVVSLVKDSLAMQGLQVQALADEVLDDIERFQNYGFTSVPLAGAEAIVLSLGGRRDHAIAIAVDDRRYRKKNLAPGESAMYTHEGDYIHMKNGRIIEVLAGTKLKVTAPEVEVIASTKVMVTTPEVEVIASTKVRLATPLVEMTGVLNVTGAITSATSVADPNGTMQEMRGTYNTHTHPENDNGGPTSAPNQQMN